MCTYLIFQLPIAYKETNPGDLPVGPGVKTPHFHAGDIISSLVREPRSHMWQGGQTNNNKKGTNPDLLG